MQQISENGSRASCSPDSKKLVYGHDGKGGLWIVDIVTKDKMNLVPDGKDPSCSPDGSLIAHVLEKRNEVIWILVANSDCKPERLVEGLHPHWTSNGEEVVYYSLERKASCAIDYKSKKTPQIVPLEFNFAVLSPDGKRFAYVESGNLWVADVKNPKSKKHLFTIGTGLLSAWSPDAMYIACGRFLGNESGI